MQTVILIRYGEIHLKGKNRPFFEEPIHPVIEMKNDIDGEAHIILQAKNLI